MKSIVFLVLFIAVSLAEVQQQQQQQDNATPVQRQSRAPQGHIQYSDPDGLKVSWKLYAPYAQWKSHLENPQRNQRAELGTAQPALGSHAELIKQVPAAEERAAQPAPVAQPLHQVQVQYKPYSMVPTHIKQLILEMYEPQGPYVDPAVYIYRAHAEPEVEEQPKEAATEQEETAQSSSEPQRNAAQPTFEHIPKFQTKYPLNKAKVGFIQYKEEQPAVAASAIPQYGTIPERKVQEFAAQYNPVQPERKVQEFAIQYNPERKAQEYIVPQFNVERKAQEYTVSQYNIERQAQEYSAPQYNAERKAQEYSAPQYNAERKQEYNVPQYNAERKTQEYSAQYNAEEQQPQQQQQQQQQHQLQQYQNSADDSMPKELHQLLNLQAQTPYHVIANRIVYKPKTLFIPKPLTDDTKVGPYKYRSKVYFIKNEEEEAEPKPKERTEREEPKEKEQEKEAEPQEQKQEAAEQQQQE